MFAILPFSIHFFLVACWLVRYLANVWLVEWLYSSCVVYSYANAFPGWFGVRVNMPFNALFFSFQAINAWQ